MSADEVAKLTDDEAEEQNAKYFEVTDRAVAAVAEYLYRYFDMGSLQEASRLSLFLLQEVAATSFE